MAARRRIPGVLGLTLGVLLGCGVVETGDQVGYVTGVSVEQTISGTRTLIEFSTERETRRLVVKQWDEAHAHIRSSKRLTPDEQEELIRLETKRLDHMVYTAAKAMNARRLVRITYEHHGCCVWPGRLWPVPGLTPDAVTSLSPVSEKAIPP